MFTNRDDFKISFKIALFFAIGSLLVWSNSGWAASKKSSIKTSKSKRKKSSKKWGFSSDFTYGQSAVTKKTTSDLAFTKVNLGLTYKSSRKNIFFTGFELTHDLKERSHQSLENSDLSLGIQHSYSKRKRSVWTQSTAVISQLPLSKNSHDNSLQFSMGVKHKFNFKSKNKSLRKLIFHYNIGIIGQIYKYYESKTGAPNRPYHISHTVTAGYRPTRSFQLLGAFSYANHFNYENESVDSFSATEAISYNSSPHLAWSIGHTNSGSALKPNQQDSNLNFADDIGSLIFTSIQWSYQ